MITLHFGRYNGRKDVIQKLTTLTALNEIFVISRTPFDPLNPTFTLTYKTPQDHAMYNYGWFEYHTKKYCGWLNWVYNNEATYTVNMYIDPITTAYENGCLNVSAKVLYSNSGSAFVKDERLTYSEQPTIFYHTETPSQNQKMACILIYNPATPNAGSLGVSTLSSTECYCLGGENPQRFWDEYLYKTNEEDRASTMGSILKTYSFRYLPSKFGIAGVKKISIRSVINPMTGNNEIKTVHIAPTDFTCNWVTPLSENIYRDMDFSVNYTITPYNADVPIVAHFPYIGDFTFRPIDYNLTSLTSIGVRIYFDFWGARYIGRLRINNTERYNQLISSAVEETYPFPYSENVNDMRYLMYDTALSLTNVTSPMALFGTVGSFGRGLIEPPQTANLKGVVGSSMSAVAKDRVVFYSASPKPHTDISGYQSLYGKPDGIIRNIATITGGYIQTENVELKVNNLPIAIIREAEAQLNSGVWVS